MPSTIYINITHLIVHFSFDYCSQLVVNFMNVRTNNTLDRTSFSRKTSKVHSKWLLSILHRILCSKMVRWNSALQSMGRNSILQWNRLKYSIQTWNAKRAKNCFSHQTNECITKQLSIQTKNVPFKLLLYSIRWCFMLCIHQLSANWKIDGTELTENDI